MTTKTVAVVTGASSGMGRSCVDTLRGGVDELIAVDLRAPQIEGTVGVACDVSDPKAVQRLADQTRELGIFRGLAHAAGISPTMGDARLMFDVDLVVPHQANLRIIQAACQRLGIPEERTAVVIDRYGNTTAGTLMITDAR